MLLSRTLAKSRIARGERPSWAAAWTPVAFDAACMVVIFLLLLRPFGILIQSWEFPLWATIAFLLALCFIPTQAVLIMSSLWATKSRWTEPDPSE